ncbi:JAB1/Mov34/MPN/PAD-1 ubiquitin protease-domain-containing protein [Scenedesmus sp. NREL 46B-D3]|nr:JAB1/Mov34/MPN/PAD-1 ubiquitin protease-domain-containing protein [Scenedesmus sp. NREL 46B-D3]
MASTSDTANARMRWELENSVQNVSTDALYKFDEAEQKAIQSQKPWTKDPHYFKHVRMSALALLKIAMHARSGGSIEVMGLMQGKVQGDSFVVIDSFALPVEGTETRVNAQAEGYEYMVDFQGTTKDVGRLENIVGWYHSHPGYGCWLSGIDCSTQMLNQQYQEPWLAVVVDPVRTMASGKVEIGAFRTYPEGYKPPDEGPSEYQTIPLSKIEDFGVHAKSYYSLDVSFFKSGLDSHLLDLLWNKYWVNTLSASPLIANREFAAGQIADIAEKLEQADSQLAQGARLGRYSSADRKKGEEGPLLKICRDTTKLSAEQIKGLSSQVIKSILFNCNPRLGPPQLPQQAAAAAAGEVAAAPAAAAAEPAAAVAGEAAALAAAADGDAAMEAAPAEPDVPAAARVPDVAAGEGVAAAAAQPAAAAEQGEGAGASGGGNAQPMEI